MTDTTRPDGVEAIMELAESYCEKRHTLGAPEYNVVTARARDTLRAATVAALTAPASKPAGITDEQIDAVIEAVRRSIGGLAPASTNYWLHRDAAAQGIREALSHAKPAEGGVVDERVAFEAWAKDKAVLHSHHSGRYSSEITSFAWEAWRARAALARGRGE